MKEQKLGFPGGHLVKEEEEEEQDFGAVSLSSLPAPQIPTTALLPQGHRRRGSAASHQHQRRLSH